MIKNIFDCPIDDTIADKNARIMAAVPERFKDIVRNALSTKLDLDILRNEILKDFPTLVKPILSITGTYIEKERKPDDSLIVIQQIRNTISVIILQLLFLAPDNKIRFNISRMTSTIKNHSEGENPSTTSGDRRFLKLQASAKQLATEAAKATTNSKAENKSDVGPTDRDYLIKYTLTKNIPTSFLALPNNEKPPALIAMLRRKKRELEVNKIKQKITKLKMLHRISSLTAGIVDRERASSPLLRFSTWQPEQEEASSPLKRKRDHLPASQAVQDDEEPDFSLYNHNPAESLENQDESRYFEPIAEAENDMSGDTHLVCIDRDPSAQISRMTSIPRP